jgi:Ca-activated chloride channel family protein
MKFDIESIEWLWLLLALAGFAYLAYWYNKARQLRLQKLGNLEVLQSRWGISTKMDFKSIGLILTGLLFCIIALTNPRMGEESMETQTKGSDVFIVMDLSKSMNAQDIQPSRLSRAKMWVEEFVAKSTNSRVGLVFFAGKAYLQMPLTEDLSAVSTFIEMVNTDLLPSQGTAVDDAIDLARKQLERTSKTSKNILLITDGENHGNDATDAADLCKASGIKLFSVGVGTKEGGTITDYSAGQEMIKRDDDGNPVISRLDEKGLKKLAQVTGGIYVNLDQGTKGIIKINSAMDGQSTTTGKSRIFISSASYFMWFLGPGILLLVLGFYFSERRSVVLKWVLILGFSSLFHEMNHAQTTLNIGKAADRSYRDGKYEAAERGYENAAKQKPKQLIYPYNKGNALYKQKKFEEASKQYNQLVPKVISDKEMSFRVNYNAGNSELEQEKYDEAIKAYRTALKAKPADKYAQLNLSIALKKKKQKEQKEQEEKQHKNDPNKDQNKEKNNPENQKSKEESKRILEIIKNEEQNALRKLSKGKSSYPPNGKDW